MNLFRKAAIQAVIMFLCLAPINVKAQDGPWVIFEQCYKTVYDIVFDSMNLGSTVAQCVNESYKIKPHNIKEKKKVHCGCKVMSGQKKEIIQPTNK